VGSGGVVRDPAVHKSVLERVVSGACVLCVFSDIHAHARADARSAGIEAMGFTCQGTVPSPLRGAKEGNIEFLSAFTFVNPDAALPAPAAGEAEDEEEEEGGGENAPVL
jgi:23S rRNA (cytidine1920-2'-O)/16S rRNA (cytidine1409-2'-O)-methyltransferase